MAAWLSRRALSGKTTWLLSSSPVYKSHVCCRKVGRTSSAPGALSALQDKPRTVEDLPHVSLLEMLYRMVFQGYYNRLHELQVCQSLIWMSSCSVIQKQTTEKLLVKSSVCFFTAFCLQPPCMIDKNVAQETPPLFPQQLVDNSKRKAFLFLQDQFV